MFATWGRGTERRASALAIVALLVSVLSILALAAVTYFMSSLQSDTDLAAGTRAFYVAEAARADAFAHVVNNPAEISYESGPRVLRDNNSVRFGEYSYTVSDITLPEQSQRRRVEVHAYWKSQAEFAAERHTKFHMEQSGEAWSVVSYMKDG